MGEDQESSQDSIAGSISPEALVGPSRGDEEYRTEAPHAAEIPGKVKYPHSDLIDTLIEEYVHASAAKEAEAKFGNLVFGIYELYKPQVIRLVRRYGNFSNHSDEEDMRQTAYEAITDLIRTYQNSITINMKLSTFLDWKIRSACQKHANNTKDVFVEITTPDGALYRRVSYNEWQALKKKLTARGYTGTTVRPQQLSTLFEHDGGPDDNISMSIADMDEPLVEAVSEAKGSEENELFFEPEQDIHREIDSIYRTSRHMDISSPAGAHVVTKVYELYRRHLLALASRYTADGSAQESNLQRATEAEIVMTWKTYDDGIAPGSRYSLYLESQMRRMLHVLLGRD